MSPLLAQTDKLTVLEKAELNAPLLLDELGAAAAALANDKCPGPDGAPVEFYKAHWQTVGPLVHQCITRGIEEDNFPEFLTKGTIVLLKKKADQRLLANKRPITLLNTIYKIGAKAIQRRVTPILQRIISPEQSAFLPGRNIHHTLFLLSEMLHQAKKLGHDHILLKLDVCKAFKSMEWQYILATVEKAGMNGILSGFLKASFRSASSNIIINGRPTPSFKLARSVRQGCPLSPLIFILGFDNLSGMIRTAQIQRTIVGVDFSDIGISTILAMFADDTHLLIRAETRYISAVKAILDTFAAASGLHFAWDKTIAALIPEGPPPMHLWLYPWTWEENANASKSLGIPVASSFSTSLMES